MQRKITYEPGFYLHMVQDGAHKLMRLDARNMEQAIARATEEWEDCGGADGERRIDTAVILCVSEARSFAPEMKARQNALYEALKRAGSLDMECMREIDE
jgi:hypothetical protein